MQLKKDNKPGESKEVGGSFPLRALEKKYMHTDALPQINPDNACSYAVSKRILNTESSILQRTITIYEFEGGLLYIPSPLVSALRKRIVELVLTQLLYLPYRNSLDRAIDLTGTDIYKEFKEGTKSVSVPMHPSPKAIIRVKQDPYASEEVKQAYLNQMIIAAPVDLIKKIRWSSIGVYYDWEKKAYDTSVFMPFPGEILSACKEIASLICNTDSFTPETAVINYYQSKDRIMSHTDRYEEDMTKPLISFSFGCSCAFVVGKKEKESPDVSSFLLQDGDIVILNGRSREYMHGVPRIYKENKGEQDYLSETYFPLIQHSRINISVRQAFKH